jgi:membrane protein implicated in regulation of membrane protease activity
MDLLVDQLQKYNPIVWQAPAALLAANILALDKLLLSSEVSTASKPWVLLALGAFNLAFIFALYLETAAVHARRRVYEQLRPTGFS